MKTTSKPPGRPRKQSGRKLVARLPIANGRETPEDDRRAFVEAVCHLIAEKGHSLRSACEKLGVHRQTFERWVAASPAHTCAIAGARAEYRERLVEQAHACQTKWGTPDPQVTMFLLERTQREDFGPEAKAPAVSVTIQLDGATLAALQDLQRRRNARETPVIEAEAQAERRD